MALSEAQRAAYKRYSAKLSMLTIRVSHDEKRIFETAAAQAGMSLNQFIVAATREKIQRETQNKGAGGHDS